MRLNEDGKTVRAMDILFPGIGEMVGGSQREERLDVLIEKMKALDGISYQRIDKETGKTEIGFTAQNIREQFAELVTEDPKGYLQTSYGSMTAILTEALKELENKLVILEKKKDEIKKLKAKISKL